jgi:hypothetical protein
MSDMPVVATPPPSPGMTIQNQVGWCALLSGMAAWLSLWGHWIIASTYEGLRGRTDLDMPDWFAINVNLTFKVLPLFSLAIVFNLVSGLWFFGWAACVSWVLRIGFSLQWLASMGVVFLLGRSWFP